MTHDDDTSMRPSYYEMLMAWQPAYEPVPRLHDLYAHNARQLTPVYQTGEDDR